MKRIVVFALLLNAALLGVIAHQLVAIAGGGPVATENGDTNGDGRRNIGDAIYLLGWLYMGGPGPVALADSPELQARVDDHAGEIAEMRAEIVDLTANQIQLLRNPVLQNRNFGNARFLSDVDFRDADLRGARFSGGALVNADLTGANLRGADLRGADLMNANITNCDLRGMYISNPADLEITIGTPAFMFDDSACDLAGPGAFLFGNGINLRNCELRGANLEGANLEGADLRGADLVGANLRGVILYGALQRGANMQDADLRGAVGLALNTGVLGTPAFMPDDPLDE